MKLEYRGSQLANGLRVATCAMPRVDSVAMGLWVGVGGRHESSRQSGISHFIEHLLFKGTERRGARALSAAIEGRGGYLNAFTQEECTCYYARVSADHTRRAFDILTDMYQHPRFAPEDVEKERGVILEEIMMGRDQPAQLVSELLGESLWAGHPLGRPLAGSERTVSHLNRADLLSFKDRHYRSLGTVAAFAGRIDHDACVRLAQQHFDGLPTARARRFLPARRDLPRRETFALQKDIEQAHLALGFRVPGRHDPDRFALRLLSVLLGENMSSRLFQLIRERHGLAYAVHAGLQLFSDTGVLAVTAGLDRRRAPRALRLIIGELRRLRRDPVGSRELRRAKDYAIGQLALGLESATAQMLWAGERTLSGSAMIQPDDVVRCIEAVTSADLNRAARRTFQRGQAAVAVVSPSETRWDRTVLQEALASLE